MQNDVKNENESVVEQARAWVRDNQDLSEKAHSKLSSILRNGPVNPAALGDFRKEYGIPRPIGGWLALFDDIKRVSSQESPNEQPAVGLTDRLSDSGYWDNYCSSLTPPSNEEEGASKVEDNEGDMVKTDDSMAMWVQDNKAISDSAHNHLRRILKDGPIHPAGLGGFRHKYDIPKLSSWLSLFDDIVQLPIQDSRNGQPVVGLKNRIGDADYWRGYRTVLPLESDLPQKADSPLAKSLEWKSLGLNGDDPGEVRAEIFRAFIVSNYGRFGVDMVQACGRFVSDSKMSSVSAKSFI